FVEPEARQDLRRSRWRRVRTNVVEPFMDGGDPVRVRGVLSFAHEVGTLAVGSQHPIDERIIAAGCLLRHVPDTRVLRHGDRAHVGGKVAGDDLQEGRLPRTVAADETDFVPRGDAGRRTVEYGLALDAVTEIVDV